MKQLGLSKIATAGILALCATIAIFIYVTKGSREKEKEQEVTEYNITKQKDYNKDFDSLYPVKFTVPTRYLNRDSLYLREYYVEGCRWIGRINGGSADIGYHTISNCPKCREFFVSLSREP